MLVPDIIMDNGPMYDYYIGCPNCKAPIIFPFKYVSGSKENRPTKCRKCGETFDWDTYDSLKERVE